MHRATNGKRSTIKNNHNHTKILSSLSRESGKENNMIVTTAKGLSKNEVEGLDPIKPRYV